MKKKLIIYRKSVSEIQVLQGGNKLYGNTTINRYVNINKIHVSDSNEVIFLYMLISCTSTL